MDVKRALPREEETQETKNQKKLLIKPKNPKKLYKINKLKPLLKLKLKQPLKLKLKPPLKPLMLKLKPSFKPFKLKHQLKLTLRLQLQCLLQQQDHQPIK